MAANKVIPRIVKSNYNPTIARLDTIVKVLDCDLDTYTKIETDALLATKQDNLTAGTNITIDANNVISASGVGDVNAIYVDTLPSVGAVDTIYFNSGKMWEYINNAYVDVTNNIDVRNQVGRLLLRHNTKNATLTQDGAAPYLNFKNEAYPIGIKPSQDTELGGIYQYDKDTVEVSSIITNVLANGDTDLTVNLRQKFTDLQGQPYFENQKLIIGIKKDGTRFTDLLDDRLTTASKFLVDAINEINNKPTLSFEDKYADTIARWESKCLTGTPKEYGRYNSTTQLFECNDVLDINLGEAIGMLDFASSVHLTIPSFYNQKEFRTTLSLCGDVLQRIIFNTIGTFASNLQSIRYTTNRVQIDVNSDVGKFVYYTRDIQNIYGEIVMGKSPTKQIRLNGLISYRFIIGSTDSSSFDWDMSGYNTTSDFDSLFFMLNNWGNTTAPLLTARTLTLHIDLYDKIYNPANPDYATYSPLSVEATRKNINITV